MIPAWAIALWKLLRAVPWQVWLGIALWVAVWQYGAHRYAAGVDDTDAKWQAAQRAADAKQREQVAARDNAADTIATNSDQRAAQQVADTRSTTAGAVERVRYEIRTVQVPAVCDGDVPVIVRDELRQAVERATAAGSPLRKGVDP